jgi:hypothetical protein
MNDFPILDAVTDQTQPAKTIPAELRFVVDAELASVGGGGGLMDY